MKYRNTKIEKESKQQNGGTKKVSVPVTAGDLRTGLHGLVLTQMHPGPGTPRGPHGARGLYAWMLRTRAEELAWMSPKSND